MIEPNIALVPFISIMSFLLTLKLAAIVSFIKSYQPLDMTGCSEDDIEKQENIMEHIVSCGLIYPAIYFYIWFGLQYLIDTKVI